MTFPFYRLRILCKLHYFVILDWESMPTWNATPIISYSTEVLRTAKWLRPGGGDVSRPEGAVGINMGVYWYNVKE
jgi:hypothetical protein